MKGGSMKYKRKKKHDNQLYNEPFKKKELKVAIKQQKKLPVEDNIHPRMIKRLPSKTMMYLFDLYNRILENGFTSKGWKSASIISL